ncbi:MAG: hypothetical protein HON55_03085 [Legionellales bacterium]|nr:hypothetical protein [Legionellales bacterium]
MPNITHQSNTYKLTDNNSLERSNLDGAISNFLTGDITADTERYLAPNANQHPREGAIVNDMNAISTGPTPTAEQQKKPSENLYNVLETVIVDPGMICAVKKEQEQTYITSFSETKISYEGKQYMFYKPDEEFIYSFAKDSDDSFTFTTLRKEVVSVLLSDGHDKLLTLDDSGDVIENELDSKLVGKKPIYTFTEETNVTYRWLDLNEIKEKVGGQSESLSGLSNDNIEKMSTLLAGLKGAGTIDGLTNYITENCSKVEEHGKSLKEGLEEKREAGEFSLYFKKGVEAIKGAVAVDATPEVEAFEPIPQEELSVEGEAMPAANAAQEGVLAEPAVAVEVGGAEPAVAVEIEEAKFISEDEAGKLGEDKVLEFKFMKYEDGVVLPQFFLKSRNPRENHLRMSSEGNLQMAFPDEIKRKMHLQIDERFNAENKELGFEKEGEHVNGLQLVASSPCYSDAAHIAKTIELISKVSEEHSDENPLLLGDPDDQIKKQIEDRLEYKVEPIMAKPEFKQDLAAIHTLSESLAKVSSVLGARGADKNPELKAKVDEKIKTLETYKNQIKEQIENRLVDQVEPIMAKPEFKQDLAAIHRMSETLVGISDVLKARGAGENPELKAKVDEKIKTLETYKILNNDISSNKAHKNKWYASALIFAAVTAVAIVVPLVVAFPPALAVLAVVVPVVCAVVSLASAYKGYEYQDKEDTAKSALSGERYWPKEDAEKAAEIHKDSGQKKTCPVAYKGGTELGTIIEERPSDVSATKHDDIPKKDSKNGSPNP